MRSQKSILGDLVNSETSIQLLDTQLQVSQCLANNSHYFIRKPLTQILLLLLQGHNGINGCRPRCHKVSQPPVPPY